MSDNELSQHIQKLSIFTEELNQASDSYERVGERLSKLQENLEPQINQMVHRIMEKHSDQLEQWTQRIVEQLRTAEKEVIQTTNYIEGKMKLHYFFGISVSVLIGLALIVLPSWYLISKKKEIQNIKYHDTMQKALKQYEFDLCGKDLCIKENRKAPTWRHPKTKEKYYIVR